MSNNNNYWIWTNSGKEFSYTHLDKSKIDIEDIAHALSLTCRFSGHVDIHYSVADHCCNLVEFLEDLNTTTQYSFSPKFLLGILLHDASEAYLGDVPSPAKKLLPDYKSLENKLKTAIFEKFNCPLNDPEFDRILNYYDKNIVRDEAEELFNKVPWWVEKYDRVEAPIWVSTTPVESEERFLDHFFELMENNEI